MKPLPASSLLRVVHAGFAALAATASAQSAEQARAELADWSVPRLQTAYLECDRLASRMLLDSSTAAACSTVAEVTLRRAFDGDFQRLLEWWRTARQPRPVDGGAAP